MFCFKGRVELVIYPFIGSLIFDFLDGFAARLLNAKSEMGKELDSLADMVSFGLLPGVILFQLVTYSLDPALIIIGDYTIPHIEMFAITLFSAVRLAKFNIDTRQTENFIGLPTPACAIFFVGILQIAIYDPFGLESVVMTMPYLMACMVVFSLLLITELPMFGLKVQ